MSDSNELLLKRWDLLLTRRDLLKISASLTGGFLVGCSTISMGERDPAGASSDVDFFNPWLEYSNRGQWIFYLDRAEMGQGVLTSLTTLAAEELELPPQSFEIRFASADKKYTNRAMGYHVTGGSTSVAMAWNPLREAAAWTRDWLKFWTAYHIERPESANQRINSMALPPELLQNYKKYKIETNRVVSPSGKELSIAELLKIMGPRWALQDRRSAIWQKVEPLIRLKKPAEYKFIGQSTPRMDLLAKVTGRAVFGIDVNAKNYGQSDTAYSPHSPQAQETSQSVLANLHIGLIYRVPFPGWSYRLKPDALENLKQKSGASVHLLKNGIAFLGRTYWQAYQGYTLLELDAQNFPSRIPENYLAFESTDNAPNTWTKSAKWRDTDYLASMKSKVPATSAALNASGGAVYYEVPFLPHMTMEPQNCTAAVSPTSCKIWVATQTQGGSLEAAAEASGLRIDQVEVHSTYIGGGFGRRLATDFVSEAVTLARLAKVPVKMIFTREDDVRHDYFRTASGAWLSARMSGAKITDWRHEIVSPSLMSYFANEYLSAAFPKLASKQIIERIGGRVLSFLESSGVLPSLDILTSDGAKSLPYELGKKSLKTHYHVPALPIGFWRSVGVSSNAFAIECFLDELAVAAKISPLDFRRGLLMEAISKKRRTRAGRPRTGPDRIDRGEDFDRQLSSYVRQSPLSLRESPVFIEPDAERMLNVMSLASQKANTRPKLAAQSYAQNAVGMANVYLYGSYCTAILQLGTNDGIHLYITRVTIAADIGRIIDIKNAKSQLEGAFVFGLSAALKQGVHFDQNGVVESNFHNSEVLRMYECPFIETHLVGETATQNWPIRMPTPKPTGVGELTVPAAAPALCNAIYALTKQRIRKLPLVDHPKLKIQMI